LPDLVHPTGMVNLLLKEKVNVPERRRVEGSPGSLVERYSLVNTVLLGTCSGFSLQVHVNGSK
jgi:hypothetical protein